LTIDWRTIGDLDIGIWRRTLHDARSPLEFVAAEAYESASPHTALALAMLNQESSYATQFRLNVASNHNPLNLRPPDGDGYLRFDSWVDGVRAWRERITDADYKSGIYARTRTIADLISVYAPSSDNNNEQAYVAGIEASLLRWGVTPKEIQPLSITTGRVPYPDVIQSHLPASNPYVVEAGAPKIPEAIFWHRMIGSWAGTNSWMHMGNAATAYGVAVAATDGASAAGKIYEWIARTGWYGESSGPARGPYGDGLIYANEVGVESINRCSKAVEISGNYDTPLDEKARDAIAGLTAYWADQRGIPWTEFPQYKEKGRSFVIWHNEITGLDYKECPGAVVMAETDALIERTKQIMKRYQEDAVIIEPEKPKAAPIWWKAGEVGAQKRADGFIALAMLGEVTAKKPVTIRTTANAKAPAIVTLKQGEKRRIAGTMRAPDNAGTRWVFIETSPGSDEWGRARYSSFEERFPTP